jgi:hypothetical protein
MHEQRKRVYHKGLIGPRGVVGGRRLSDGEPECPPAEGGVGASCLDEGLTVDSTSAPIFASDEATPASAVGSSTSVAILSCNSNWKKMESRGWGRHGGRSWVEVSGGFHGGWCAQIRGDFHGRRGRGVQLEGGSRRSEATSMGAGARSWKLGRADPGRIP